jgi:PAS domain S-box-containing protein
MSDSDQQGQSSEEPIWTILDHSMLGIAIIQDNTLPYLNKRFAEMFGYTITEMREWPLEGFVVLLHPEEKEFILDYWRKIHQGNLNGSIAYPIRGITKSGATVWLKVSFNQISLEGKAAVLVNVMDVSEKKANELLIQKLLRDLEIQTESLKQINEERDEYPEIRTKSPNSRISLLWESSYSSTGLNSLIFITFYCSMGASASTASHSRSPAGGMGF